MFAKESFSWKTCGKVSRSKFRRQIRTMYLSSADYAGQTLGIGNKGYFTNLIYEGFSTKFPNELYTFSVWMIFNVEGPE